MAGGLALCWGTWAAWTPVSDAAAAGTAGGKCPFGFDSKMTIRELTEEDLRPARIAARSPEYVAAAQALDWDDVVQDLTTLFHADQPDIYPIDHMLDGTTSYGPFFVRQAWHCSGSYRVTDGLGGCSGGRQRFDPELSWPDNTNLDKAKRLLWPIKDTYGMGLSWGDLMILAGKVAIETMGGPWVGFCAGRPDDPDGSRSELLGPTLEQGHKEPCAVQGLCERPFGTTNIGLIYLNPQGHMGNYLALNKTVADVNSTFGRMSMDEEETVALIGGGHAFGKTHGACAVNTSDPSVWPDPLQDPADPWPITACPNGTFTTGFEGFWTSQPNRWSNEYYTRLVYNNFTGVRAPGGNTQYQQAGASYRSNETLMMLPSDVSLLHNPAYNALVHQFAANFSYLTEAFAAAWYKLTTRDSGPVARCLNITIGGQGQLPPAQPFQFPVPPAPTPLPDYEAVKAAVRQLLFSAAAVPPGFAVDQAASNSSSGGSSSGGSSSSSSTTTTTAYWGAIFAHLSFQCAATIRTSDHLGGCTGARIRFEPQSRWVWNTGMDVVIGVLDAAVRTQFPTLTNSDLIVLAGTVAVEEALKLGRNSSSSSSSRSRSSNGTVTASTTAASSSSSSSSSSFSSVDVPFCGGRGDATEGYPMGYLMPGFNLTGTSRGLSWNAVNLGLSEPEWIALQARPRSPSQMVRMGFPDVSALKPVSRFSATAGATAGVGVGVGVGGGGGVVVWGTHAPLDSLDNSYFQNLFGEDTWTPFTAAAAGGGGGGGGNHSSGGSDTGVYVSTDGTLLMTAYDMLLLWDPEHKAVAQQFAEDGDLFAQTFASAWVKLMNMDRFAGPTGNLCDPQQ